MTDDPGSATPEGANKDGLAAVAIIVMTVVFIVVIAIAVI